MGIALTFIRALFGKGPIVSALHPFVGHAVRVMVWGAQIIDESPLIVDSVRSFGAGLLIFIRRGAGGPRTLLKVAQPKHLSVVDGRVEIAQARYVSWGGRKLTMTPGVAAVTIERR